jgi:hypothetical protein
MTDIHYKGTIKDGLRTVFMKIGKTDYEYILTSEYGFDKFERAWEYNKGRALAILKKYSKMGQLRGNS